MKRILSFLTNKKILAITTVLLFAMTTVLSLAYFTDRVELKASITTTSFSADGYAITRTPPAGPFAAGEDVVAKILETNPRDDDIKTAITLTVTWDSPDPDSTIFGNANAADNATLTFSGEGFAEDVTFDNTKYTLVDNKTITCVIPYHVIPANATNYPFDLTLHIPESFYSTGNIEFTFGAITVSQSPVGFTADFNPGTSLDYDVRVGWAASSLPANNGKTLMGFLADAAKAGEYRIVFEYPYGDTESPMKDFAFKTDAKWSYYKGSTIDLAFISGMTTIGDYAFPDFERITSLTLPQSVTAVGTYAFDNISIPTLSIPANTTTFETMSFGHIDELVEISFSDTTDATLELPTAGETTGAFYVTPYVEPTNRTKIIATNTDALEYDWVGDHRKLVPIMQSWAYDATTDFHAAKDEINTVRFTNTYALPNGFDASAGNGPWDVSAAQDKSVMAYITNSYDAFKTLLSVTIGKAELPAGTGTLYNEMPTWDGTKFTSSDVYASGKTVDEWAGDSYPWRYYFVSDADPTVVYEWDSSTKFIKYYYDYAPAKIVTISSNTGWTEDVIANESSRYICYEFEALRSFDGTHLDTSTAQDMRQMFCYCYDLINLNLGSWDVSNVQNFYGMFNGCTSLSEINLNVDLSAIDDANLNDDTDKEITLGWGESTDGICGGLGHMFGNCRSLTALDVSGWDLSKAQSLCNTFYYCNVLEQLDVVGWDVSGIKTFDSTFYSCYILEQPNVSEWDVSSAEIMYGMFGNCGFTTLAVNDWNVSKVTDFGSMFYNCINLEYIDVSQWDTSSAEYMNSMFWCCESLDGIDVSDWNVGKVIDFYYTFADCTSLTSLDVSKWDTSSVQSFYHMFENCETLTHIDVSTKVVYEGTPNEYTAWDTSHADNFEHMFAHCYELTTLNVSDWVVTGDGLRADGEAKGALNTRNMFAGTKIQQLVIGPGWDEMNGTLYGALYLNDITFEHDADDALVLSGKPGKRYGLAFVGADGSMITSSPYNADNLMGTTIHVSCEEVKNTIVGYNWVDDFRDVTVVISP